MHRTLEPGPWQWSVAGPFPRHTARRPRVLWLISGAHPRLARPQRHLTPGSNASEQLEGQTRIKTRGLRSLWERGERRPLHNLPLLSTFSAPLKRTLIFLKAQ